MEKKLNSIKSFFSFKKRILSLSRKLNLKIKSLTRKGKLIHIYGASTKGNISIQYSKIDTKYVSFAADRNPLKWNKKMPGSNIPIISEKTSRSKNPDYYLILPWHFREEFIKREKIFLSKGGKLIFPLPKIKIISKKNL